MDIQGLNDPIALEMLRTQAKETREWDQELADDRAQGIEAKPPTSGLIVEGLNSETALRYHRVKGERLKPFKG